jgi:hypothetical protein
MVGKQSADDEILNRIKTRDRVTWRMLWGLMSGIALVLAATAAAIFSGHAALVTGMRGRIVTAAVLGALFVYALVTIVRGSMRPVKADGPRFVHCRMDIYQRRRRQTILLNVFVMFFAIMSLSELPPVLRATHQQPLLLGVGALIAGYMLMLVVLLSAGPRWQSTVPGAGELPNDEFDSALRARTMRLGYILAMLLLGAVLLVALWQPDLTRTALCCALYAGYAVPALYYLVADGRASRGDEG